MGQKPTPKIGEDVSAMMPAVGDDVSSLMNEKTLGGFAANTIAGIPNFFKGIGQGAVDTFKLWKATQDAQSDPKKALEMRDTIIATVKNSPAIAKAIVAAGVAKYGSPQKVWDSFYKDPVGVIGDVSAALAAVGSGGETLAPMITKFAPQAVETANAISRAAKIASTASEYSNPLNLVTKPAAVALKAAAPVIYEKGLNRTSAMKREFPDAAKVGVAERVVPTQAKVDTALTDAEKRLMGNVQAHDAASPAGTIDPKNIVERARETAMREGKIGDRALREEPLADLQAYVDQFNKENPDKMSAEQTLKMKRAEQREAFELRKDPTKTDKGLYHMGTAQGAREELLSQVPAAEADLTREQGLLGIKDAVDNPRSSPMGHKLFTASLLGSLAPTALMGHPGAAAGELATLIGASAMKNPAVMGGLGIGADVTADMLRSPAFQEATQRANMLRMLSQNNPFVVGGSE